MAVFNQIWNRKYSEALNRLLRIQEGTGLESLSPELTASFILELERPEWYLLRGVSRYGAVPFSIAGGVGQFSFIQMPLPATAKVIAIVEEAACDNTVTVSARVNSTLRSGGTSGHCLDRRTPNPTVASSIVGNVTGNAAAAEGVAVDFSNATAASGQASEFRGIRNRFVIAPGQSLTFWAETANVAFQMALTWMEKPVGTDELQLG